MKNSFLLAILSGVVMAQAPPGAAPITPSTVVARTADGKDITAGELDQKRAAVPGASQALRSDPANFVQMMMFQQYMAEEARKLKLEDTTPWKEQIDLATQNVLLSAYISYVRNHNDVTVDRVETYYKQHADKYQQSVIKAFIINFKPPVVNDPKNVEGAAQAAFAREHSTTNRTEAEAKKMADDAVKQLRAGGDFAKMVDKYADDTNKKSAAEDTMTIKSTGPYPAELQKAVLGLKPGDVPEPVHQVNAFYVVKVVEVAAQPLNSVREDITQAIKAEYTQTYVEELQKRFRPTIVRPDYFIQPGPGK